MTFGDVINAALRELRVLASGETPSANESNDALIAFNNMLDSWSTQRLLIYSILREVFPLTAGQQTYTWGTAGNFNSSRPQRIQNAAVQAYGTNPVAEIPLKLITQPQYASIIIKTVTSSLPMWLYNDNANPLTNINLWPVPSVGINLVTYAWKTLGTGATLPTVITLPPGYLRMMIKNLAIELAPMFGVSPSEILVGQAIASFSDVKRMNSKPIFMAVDPALTSNAKGSFNWLTGDTE